MWLCENKSKGKIAHFRLSSASQKRACLSSLVWSLSTRVFETRTDTGSELFSLLTCLHTTTFTLLSIFSPLEMINTKIWETPLSWYAKCSLPVAVRVLKTRVLKLPGTWDLRRDRHRERHETAIGNLRSTTATVDENVTSKYNLALSYI